MKKSSNNSIVSKYCRGCGYGLPKFSTNNQTEDKPIIESSNRKIRLIECFLLALLYIISQIVIPLLFPIPNVIGGTAILFMLLFSNFILLTTALFVGLLFVKYRSKNIQFVIFVFIIGILLTLIINFCFFKF